MIGPHGFIYCDTQGCEEMAVTLCTYCRLARCGSHAQPSPIGTSGSRSDRCLPSCLHTATANSKKAGARG
jgi:hypothetical protein